LWNLFAGKLEKKRGNYLEAQKCYQRAQEIIRVVFGENHPKYAFILNDLGVSPVFYSFLIFAFLRL
jgi:hypothetical protein